MQPAVNSTHRDHSSKLSPPTRSPLAPFNETRCTRAPESRWGIILASLRPFRNAATFDALKARTPPGVRRWMDCTAPHPQGGALLLRPSSALILFEAGILGLAGVRRPGRSMGPPHLHRMSERHIVVANLGYTPRSPVPRFRTPPASPAWRGSLVADSRSGF